jgi:glutaredoxin
MKTKYYWMKGCPHCIKTKQVMDNVGFTPDESIERSDMRIADKTKYGIHLYPTLVILDDSGFMIDKLEGQLDEKTLNASVITNTASTTLRESYIRKINRQKS